MVALVHPVSISRGWQSLGRIASARWLVFTASVLAATSSLFGHESSNVGHDSQVTVSPRRPAPVPARRSCRWWGDCWSRFWKRPLPQRIVRHRDAYRDALRAWSRSQPGPEYGLERAPSPPDLQVPLDRPIVVFLHGLNSRPSDLRSWVAEAAAGGLNCYVFHYPNDQSLTTSSELLSRELKSLRRADPRRPVYLVGHSMGGLIARAVVEDPLLDPGSVRRLVMVATPNHGSELARFACSLDLYEYVTSKERRAESGFLVGSIRDGYSEALQDLAPGSEFLRRLNRRSRHPRVHYCQVIGTGGPMATEPLRGLQAWLPNDSDCSWVRCAREQLDQKLLGAEELLRGYGDGVVSARRAQLAGVDDLIWGDFSHVEILGDSSNPDVGSNSRPNLSAARAGFCSFIVAIG